MPMKTRTVAGFFSPAVGQSLAPSWLWFDESGGYNGKTQIRARFVPL
jgi:hypothetical protein